MDVSTTYRDADEAVDAIHAACPEVEELTAMCELFNVPVYYDWVADRVFIVRVYDAEQPESVRIDETSGVGLAEVPDVVEFIAEDLDYCADDDGADSTRVRRWVAQLSEVYSNSVNIDMRQQRMWADGELKEGTVAFDDRIASFIDFRLTQEMKHLRDRIVVMETMRARNIRARLDARDNRPGAKLEVGKLLLLKQREVHDVLVADDRRFNLLD
ncbi:hypothetical protein [Stackebrandtia soli]|uniref:hypothetical protein n=1 Tax=Stackebrandtia soli TaxID=1892856 RepID=UPI0039ECCE07